MTFLFAIIRIILKDKRTVNDNESWSIVKGRFNQEDNFFVNEPDHQGRLACYKRTTRQSKQCGFSIYIFDNSKSKSMVRLVRAEKMVLSGLVFARKIARMILIQNI